MASNTFKVQLTEQNITMYMYGQDSADVFYINETMGDLNLFAGGGHLCLQTWTKVNGTIVILADDSSMKCLINVTSSAAFDKLSIYGTTGSDTLRITTFTSISFGNQTLAIVYRDSGDNSLYMHGTGN